MDHRKKIGSPAYVLEHTGVKGMKWGVRKAKPTSSEILGARHRQHQRLRALQREDDTASTAKSSATRKAAEKRAMSIARDFQTNEDRVTAQRMTRGEKAAAIILTGPLAGVFIAQNRSMLNKVIKETDTFRALAEQEKN